MEEVFEYSVTGTVDLIDQQLSQIAAKRFRVKVSSSGSRPSRPKALLVIPLTTSRPSFSLVALLEASISSSVSGSELEEAAMILFAGKTGES